MSDLSANTVILGEAIFVPVLHPQIVRSDALTFGSVWIIDQAQVQETLAV